jgi:hypothetical protein
MHGAQGLAPVLAALTLACVVTDRPIVGYEATDRVQQAFYNDYEQCLKQTQAEVELSHRGFLPPISDEMRAALVRALGDALLACMESRGWVPQLRYMFLPIGRLIAWEHDPGRDGCR